MAQVTGGTWANSYIRFMGRLDVDPDALEALAARCKALATGVIPAAAPASGPSGHAAAAAVEALHDAVTVAAGALALRLEETSAALGRTASDFAEREALAVLGLDIGDGSLLL